MIKYILISLLCLAGTTSTFAQSEITEAYFHELRGLEDSSGVTHLFYRQFERSSFQCSESNGGNTISSTSNNIYHFDTETKSDSVAFNDYYSPWCIEGMANSEGINDYDFYDNDPMKWIISSSFEYVHGVEDYLGNTLNFEIPIMVKQISERSYQDYFPLEFYLSPNQDSLFMDSYGTTIPFPGKSSEWPKFNGYEEFLNYADSVSFEFELMAIHPTFDSLYYAKNNLRHLYRSTKYSGDFQIADSSGATVRLAFDNTSSLIYSLVHQKKGERKLLRSNDLGSATSWTALSIPDTKSRFEFLVTDSERSGHIFLADSGYVYSSSNFGDTFDTLFTTEASITSLYKKPNSNILYVLTKKELLEINIDTKQTTSLKKLPVSNESEPSGIPNQIILKQNYPNPFNPSTVISYQLAGNSLVRLEVFDVTGRKVATLVNNQQKQSGQYQVTFEASGLASGVYFYRLEAGGQTFTQKMLLVK